MAKSAFLTQEKKAPSSGYKPVVPAVDQAARVLVCLGKNPQPKMTLTEICAQVGIHKSKGHALLHTLMQFGFVEKDPQSKRYALGPGLLFLSRRVLDRMDVRESVAPFLQEIATETKSSALFGQISSDQVFVLAKHEGNQDIGVTIRVGHRFHITSGAHGKAIVAFMPEKEQERILSRKNLYFYGDPGQVSMERLRQELAQCRKQGFARDMGGLQPGINAISAPVFGPSPEPVGCLILMGTFSERLIKPYGIKVADTAKRISYALGASSDEPVRQQFSHQDTKAQKRNVKLNPLSKTV